jgi:hypothetical protein
MSNQNTLNINMPVLGLRPYQKPLWRKMVVDNVRKAFVVWHRRAGKDLTCLQILYTKALQEKGNYWYVLPQKNQVRRSIWDGITSMGMKYIDFIPPEIVFKKNKTEMKVILRDPKDPEKEGSIIYFLGGDNYDALVGAGIKGAVISEFALQKPNLYDLVIEPMLKETKGWVIFNTTPRGENHAKDMFDFIAKKEHYYASMLTIEDTGVVHPEDLEEERERGKPEEVIQQEYYCSFEGAILGAYYADFLKRYEHQYKEYPYNDKYPVHTMWDIGVSDSMAIWFVQIIENKPYLIDYYENHTYSLGHYTEVIQDKGYRYSSHNLPHDGSHRQLTSTERALSIDAQLRGLGLKNVKVHKRTSSVIRDIQAVRAILPICHFNSSKVKDGYMALKQYRREYDEDRKKFKDSPLHDWTSHGSDAFRILPLLLKKGERPKKTKVHRAYKGGM